ncbi:MAG: sulfite exporter TauE/SafE family protein [bacterium]|nr:sulfite exporter TauE/SafE family protein [bacterium]
MSFLQKQESYTDYTKIPAYAGMTVMYYMNQKNIYWFSRNKKDYTDLLTAALILFIIYSVGRSLNLFNLNVNAAPTGLLVALLVGLVAGVSTCMALVGGLVLGLSARHAELHPEATTMQKFRPHLYFNAGRIMGYMVFGGLIGLLGQVFRLTSNTLGFLTIAIALVMIMFGLKLIEIFPALKNKSITLPVSIARALGISKEVKEYSHKNALIAGALTFFVPCGFTQTMQLYAVSTGSFWRGAAIMGLFALGTAPGLLSIGGLASIIKGQRARLFFMATGLAVIMFGWFNLTNGIGLIGTGSTGTVVQTNNSANSADTQIVRMTQDDRGYSPNTLTIKKGQPVKWIINSNSQFSCSASIMVRAYGINQALRAGENIINFTPQAVGEIPFSCSMGMYRGKFIVTE